LIARAAGCIITKIAISAYNNLAVSSLKPPIQQRQNVRQTPRFFTIIPVVLEFLFLLWENLHFYKYSAIPLKCYEK